MYLINIIVPEHEGGIHTDLKGFIVYKFVSKETMG